MSTALVTDSTADIPTGLAARYNIHVMPNIIVMDGKEVEDGKGLTREEFYRLLPDMKTLPTTATASAGSYQTLYESILSQGATSIISIHASSLLSGIFNAASTAAQAFEGRVHVIDSMQVTLGLGFQVLTAAEDIARGLSPESILQHIKEMRKRASVIALLDTLEYVRRSGRVSWARASLGTLLRIKPVIEVREGLVRSLGEARTRRKGIERLVHMVKTIGPLERIAALHTNAETEARELLEEIVGKVSSSALVVNVTTVIGTHAGPNAIGVAVVTR